MPSPEHGAIVDMLRSVPAMREGSLPIDQQRSMYEIAMSVYEPAPGTTVEGVRIGDLEAEWVTAPGVAQDGGPVIEYLHGGGYCIGSLATHRELASRISSAAGARVLVVGYRLAPEHPFPAALDDACSAYRWLLDGGVAPEALVVAGDSAGGGLALATCVRVRDEGGPVCAGTVCLSPWADLAQQGASIDVRDGEDPVVSRAALDQMAATYLAGHSAMDPLASPLHADLGGLGPLLVQVGTAEVLLDDARRVADAARAAGTPVELQEHEGLIHVFQQIAAQAPEAVEAVSRIGGFVRRVTGRGMRQD